MNNTTNANEVNFDPYLTWLGIRDPQRPPNHYRLLGLELFENDSEVIAAAADRQMTYVRTYQAGQQGEHSQRILTELTTAKLCLLKSERKRDYDERLRAAQKPPAQPVVSAAPPRNAAAPPLRAGVARPPVAQAVQPTLAQANPEALVFSNSPGSAAGSALRPTLPAKKSSAMQWSILGGLVLTTIILTVILAGKNPEPETPEVAKKTPASGVTPTATKNPTPNENPASPPEGKIPETPSTTQPEVEEPEPDKSATNNKSTSTKNGSSTKQGSSSKQSTGSATKTRPGPTKDPLPNVALPGIEDANKSSSNPKTPGGTPGSSPSNDDPLNSLPTSSGDNSTKSSPSKPVKPMAMPETPPVQNTATNEPPKPAAPRRPVPSAKEITESRVNVREVFKTDYTSRDTNTLTSLGKRLLKLAQESSDKPAMMYTTYDEARNVSVQVNDLETTFAAHEQLSREFDIDDDKDLIETVKLVAKNAATLSPENATAVLDLITESINKAILDQHLDTAEQLLRTVSSFTSRIPSFDKANRETAFRDVQKRLGEHKSFATKAKEYKETLAKNPSDGEANLELGKFWAFQQGNFEAGLSYLAKGNDPEISDTAKRELSLKPDASEYVKIAEGWWEIAGKLPADPRATVKIHAACVYARALPMLKALDRGLAESRINETFKMFKPNNRDVKELLRLLLTRTSWKMEWTSRSSYEPKLTFSPSGSCSNYEYPTWKLLDNYYVVCYRDRSSNSSSPYDRFGRFGNFGNNNNNGNSNNGNNPNVNSKVIDLAKNVMQIAVTANRIEVRVLGSDGSLRGTGVGTPE